MGSTRGGEKRMEMSGPTARFSDLEATRFTKGADRSTENKEHKTAKRTRYYRRERRGQKWRYPHVRCMGITGRERCRSYQRGPRRTKSRSTRKGGRAIGQNGGRVGMMVGDVREPRARQDVLQRGSRSLANMRSRVWRSFRPGYGLGPLRVVMHPHARVSRPAGWAARPPRPMGRGETGCQSREGCVGNPCDSDSFATHLAMRLLEPPGGVEGS
jgi:hypothetical protein